MTCHFCGTTDKEIRVAQQDPWGGNQQHACTDCYDEWFPEPDTGRPDFDQLRKVPNADYPPYDGPNNACMRAADKMDLWL